MKGKNKPDIKIDTSIITDAAIQKLPLHYRFLRVIRTKDVAKIANWEKVSTSSLHRSSGYHLECSYKPLSKFVMSNFLKDETK